MHSEKIYRKIDRRVEISIPEDKCRLCICFQIAETRDWVARLFENSLEIVTSEDAENGGVIFVLSLWGKR